MVARAARRADVSAVRGVRLWKDLTEMTVQAEPAEWLEADGELLGRVSRLTVTPNTEVLRVVAV